MSIWILYAAAGVAALVLALLALTLLLRIRRQRGLRGMGPREGGGRSARPPMEPPAPSARHVLRSMPAPRLLEPEDSP